jgi:hypothetical protein
MKKLITISIIAFLFNSCGFHTGMMTGNAELTAESEIIGFAIGQAKAVRVFNIGGLNSKTLVKDAKQDLYSGYPLKKGQAYANVVVDFRTAFFIVFNVTTATVSADIVNLEADKTNGELQGVFSKSSLLREPQLHSDLWLRSGDSLLLFKNDRPENIIVREILGEAKASVLTADNRILNTRVSNLYSDKRERTFDGIPFKAGDFVSYLTRVSDSDFLKVSAKIIGINPEKILISFGDQTKAVGPEELSIIE